MAALIDQVLLPARLLTRALDDVHRIADAAVSLGTLALEVQRELEPLNRWMRTTASELESLRRHAAGVDSAIHPIVEHVRILRDEFGRANDEIARLREAFGPELSALRTEFSRANDEVRGLQASVGALARDADEISEVVEPLQAATDRVGRVAERLPGGARRRSS